MSGYPKHALTIAASTAAHRQTRSSRHLSFPSQIWLAIVGTTATATGNHHVTIPTVAYVRYIRIYLHTLYLYVSMFVQSKFLLQYSYRRPIIYPLFPCPMITTTNNHHHNHHHHHHIAHSLLLSTVTCTANLAVHCHKKGR